MIAPRWPSIRSSLIIRATVEDLADSMSIMDQLLRTTSEHTSTCNRLWCRRATILAALALTTAIAPAAAEPPKHCELGRVVDVGGSAGIVASEHEDLCLIKYKDGQTQQWIPMKDLTEQPSARDETSAGAPAGVTVQRPNVYNRLVYRADALGHIVLTAKVNGAPVHFLVDTGATLVSLSPQDAAAVGLKRSDLTFDKTVQTGNGPVHAALAQLREIRIEQLEIDHVPAAVIDSLKQSVLGMSFLSRLKGFELRDGALTMNW